MSFTSRGFMTIFLISDTHFCHANMLTFTNADGSLVRPGFANVQEMDEHLVECWNRVVKPPDHVYHLGDVTMLRGSDGNCAPAARLLDRLNGHKRIILGNHDHNSAQWYSRWFKKVKGQNMLDGYLMTHYPVHPGSLGRAKANVHGHIHRQHVMAPPDAPTSHKRDERYINVSVEVLNYTPVALEALATLHRHV
jgi:calcineurin-like phosphoesterase family protein